MQRRPDEGEGIRLFEQDLAAFSLAGQVHTPEGALVLSLPSPAAFSQARSALVGRMRRAGIRPFEAVVLDILLGLSSGDAGAQSTVPLMRATAWCALRRGRGILPNKGWSNLLRAYDLLQGGRDAWQAGTPENFARMVQDFGEEGGRLQAPAARLLSLMGYAAAPEAPGNFPE